MKNNKNKKTKMRKLIPAIGMLAISATMLSTSTYAWFTMNREVEVTGLQMKATTSQGLEISLGAVGTALGSETVGFDAPGKDDLSWKRAILFSDYYDTIGKLKPASSNDALNIMKINEVGVYAGGHNVLENTLVSIAKQSDSAILTKSATFANATISLDDDENSSGYYIDIPMWIRSNNSEAVNVQCAVTITDGTNPNEDLKNAVRVAVIPAGDAKDNSSDIANVSLEGSVNADWATSDTASTLTGLSVIYGLNGETYNGKVIPSSMTAYKISELVASNTINPANNSLITNDNLNPPSGENDANKENLITVFQLPTSSANDYSGNGFIVRIWLEGESKFCEDATANQDWQIDLYFTIEE